MEKSSLRLNIGCGRDYRPGWINVDISKEVKAEYCLDIRKDILPCLDDSVEEIYISGVLEQIGSNEQFIHAMNECQRVLKPGTIMKVIVPNAKYAIAHRDPMDVRKFTPETFEYFLKGTQEYRLYGSVYGFNPWSLAVIDENIRHIMTIIIKK